MMNTRYAFHCALLLNMVYINAQIEPTESPKVDPFKVYQELLEQNNLSTQPTQEPEKAPQDVPNQEDNHRSFLIKSAPEKLQNLINGFKMLLGSDEKTKLPTTLLFYGPPGTGKTSSAIAFAQELGIPYTIVKSANLGTTFQNSASENLRMQIEKIEATESAHVIILDEVHFLLNKLNTNRNDTDPAGTLLHAIDRAGQDKRIIFIATANDISNFNDALNSRFNKARIAFTLPSDEQRRVAAARLLKKSGSDAIVSLVVSKTRNESYRTVEQLIENAQLKAYGEKRKDITENDIHAAFKEMNSDKPSWLSERGNSLWNHRQEIFMVLSAITGLGIKIYEIKNGNTQVSTTKSESSAKTVEQPQPSTSQAG